MCTNWRPDGSFGHLRMNSEFCCCRFFKTNSWPAERRGAGLSRLLKIGSPKTPRKRCERACSVAESADMVSYPFYSTYSASCLDTSNPLDGDQNMPYFPNYTNPVSNINITYVLNKYNTEAQTQNTSSNATSSSASASASSSASASASSTAHSGSAGRASLVPLSLLGGILVGAGGLTVLW